jgi:hypothetical protein
MLGRVPAVHTIAAIARADEHGLDRSTHRVRVRRR